MPKKCELTGKIPMKGHNVSHANNKTNRRFLPNLKKVKFKSELLKRSLTLTVSNAGMRSVNKKGTFDRFLKSPNFYHEAFRTPGNRPSRASFLKHILHIPNFL